MSSPYRLIRAPRVVEQLRALFRKAPTPLARTLFLHSLRQLAIRLETAPKELGEEAHRTRFPGGMVYKAVFQPFSIQFVLYEEQKLVLLFDVRPMPHSYIE
jgi:hypothetical protein